MRVGGEARLRIWGLAGVGAFRVLRGFSSFHVPHLINLPRFFQGPNIRQGCTISSVEGSRVSAAGAAIMLWVSLCPI